MGREPLSKPPNSSEGSRGLMAGPLYLLGRVWAWGFSILRFAPFSRPPPRGLGLSRPGSGSLVRPGLWVAVSLCLCGARCLFLSLCVSLQLLPSCLKLHARAAPGEN